MGEQTPYRDKNGKEIYTGDIVALEVDGQIREFVVDKATVDREYNTLPNFEGDTVKVRLADVVIFRWIDPEGVIHQLLPCVNEAGVSDTAFMEIIGTVAERGVQESESKGRKAVVHRYPIWVEGEYITEPPIRPSGRGSTPRRSLHRQRQVIRVQMCMR